MQAHRARVDVIVPAKRALSLGSLVVASLGLQGCLAVVWLGAVGFDVTRNSEVEFLPFENSWLAPPETRPNPDSVTSIAVTPFLETTMTHESAPRNERLEKRWTRLLRQTTDLHVVSPSELAKRVQPDLLAILMTDAADQSTVRLAPLISEASGASYVLFGRVVDEEQDTSLAGLKDKQSKRLYLYLASADGRLVWKDELPFTLVKGAKDLDERWVTQALTARVVTHAQELGLSDLGLQFKKTGS